MAENPKSRTEEKAADTAPAESTFPSERLVSEAQAFFSRDPHEVAGALALATPANKVNFTRAEAKQLLRQWDGLEQEQV